MGNEARVTKRRITEEPYDAKVSCTVLESSGSREGVADFNRSAHNAQKYLFDNLRSQSHGIEKRVIELDIEKCFDRINHLSIMERLIAPKGIKLGIFRCLKTGVNQNTLNREPRKGG